MFLKTVFSRKSGGTRKASHLALALALATGSTLGSAVLLETPAYAADRNSKAFAKAYQPLADIVNAEDGDYASAKGMVPSVVATIENEQDRFAMGNLMLALGNKTSDKALQRQGLEMMLASGKVAPEQIGQFNFFVGNLAYEAKDFAAARTALEAAIAAGYSKSDSAGLVTEAYFAEQRYSEGLAYLAGIMDSLAAEGTTPPENWYVRGLQIAAQNKLNAESIDYSTRLVKAYPTTKNWGYALSVLRDFQPMDDVDMLDLFRLMQRTNGYASELEIREYLDLAAKRGLPGEVLHALDGTANNELVSVDDTYYVERRSAAEAEAKRDRPTLDQAKADASKAGTGFGAIINTGDAFLGYGDPASAEAIYRNALGRDGDQNRVLSRIAIAQIDQGNYAAARETLSQIGGANKTLAELWTIYADSKTN